MTRWNVTTLRKQCVNVAHGLLIAALAACTAQEGLLTPTERMNTANSLALDGGYPELIDINGHTLAVLQRGDAKGFPVFYAHGNPGSRLELLYYDAQARQAGIRLITFDRPGFGQSDMVTPYNLKTYADDVSALAKHLKIEKYGLIGWSSGGPPVIATSYYYPQEVAFTYAISGYTDFSVFPNAAEFMKAHGFPGADWSANHPALFSAVVKAVRFTDLKLPEEYLDMAKEEMPPSDQAVLASPASADLFVRIQQSAVVQGTDGAVQDLKTQWQAWGFPLNKVTAPVVILQGTEDPFVPAAFPHHLALHLGNAKLKMIPQHGHLLPLIPEFQQPLFAAAKQWLETGQATLPEWPRVAE